MNTQHCKIGRTMPLVNTPLILKNLEAKYLRYVENAYNVKQLDSGLSDFFYYKATKIKYRMSRLKLSLVNSANAA